MPELAKGRGPRRRTTMIRTVGLAGLIGLAAGLAHAEPAQKPLTIVSWGGDYTRSQMLAYVKPYRKRTGAWVAMETYQGGLDEIREQVETENVVWDVVDFELSDLLRGCQEGLLETIDPGILPAGADGTPADEDFIPGALTDCGIGQTVYATVVAYDDTAFRGEPPSEIADFFNVNEFPGRRGLRRDPRVVMEWALLADGVPADQVYDTLATDEGRDRAFAVLDRIKPYIVWWTDGEEPAALLASGRVAMTSVWNGRMFRPIIEEDKPFTILWDGQVWEIDSWGIPKGTYNLEKALDFIRFATASEQLADQATYISYGPARESSLAMIDDETTRAMLPTSAENRSAALKSDAGWWAEHHDELAAEFEAWFAGGGRGLSGTAR